MSPPGDAGASLLTRPFVLLCLATFFLFLSFQLILPVVPLYAARLGAREADVGLVVGVFAFAAMLLRPVAGQLADHLGRRPLVLAGAAIFAGASLGYALLGRTLAALLALRFVHGVGMGLGPTAGTAMVADLAPPARRGTAMGLYGITMTVGLAVGPYAGAALAARAGFRPAFALAGGLAAVALALAWTLPETRPRAARRGPGAGASWAPAALFSAAALYPSALVLALFFGYGGVVSFLPLFTERAGLGNPGLFFTAFAVAVAAVRAPAGHLADRLGRRMVVAPALGLAAAALLLLAHARSAVGLGTAAALFGAGFGAAQPGLLAMTADRVPPEARGRAMGTLYTAWELGISAGSVCLGLYAAEAGYPAMWRLAAGVAALGALGACYRLTRPRG